MSPPEAPADRARRMARRVATTAEKLGLPPEDVERVERAHALAMGPRERRLPDDHHPDFLHPGRTQVILLDDLALTEPAALAAAALVETERPELAVPAGTVAEVLGTTVREFLDSVPRCGPGRGEDVVEALVTAPPDAALVALAERLDQIRHAHLWDDLERRREAHREATEILRPVADRLHPVLSRRYGWWCRMFEERHLG